MKLTFRSVSTAIDKLRESGRDEEAKRDLSSFGEDFGTEGSLIELSCTLEELIFWLSLTGVTDAVPSSRIPDSNSVIELSLGNLVKQSFSGIFNF